MPQINRIRVNNVNYNDGTQRYDDFLMKFDCHNALYDLVNGGGKSILLMLILQTILPNQELDKKQPVSKLFKSSNNNNTIHSMVEWKLDKEARKRYKANYLVTGFCAKKGTEGKGEVEYFNYLIMYNEYNNHDIRNFELVSGNERTTFGNMRKKLKAIQDGNYMDCKVELFDTNESYKRRLCDFGIYESHWNIVRGINESEGHVRTYIEKNYKSARQLVDRLLINEIIDKANETKLDNKEEEMLLADSLIEIKDKLVELSIKNKDKAKYERQAQSLMNYIEKLSMFEKILCEKDDLYSEFSDNLKNIDAYYNTVKSRLGSVREEIVLKKGINVKESQIIELLQIEKLKNDLIVLNERLNEANDKHLAIENSYNQAKENLNFIEGKSYYLKYKENKKDYDTRNEELLLRKEKNTDMMSVIKELAGFIKVSLDENIKKIENDINENKNSIIEARKSIDEHEDVLENINQKQGEVKSFIKLIESEIDKNKKLIDETGKKIHKLQLESSVDSIFASDEELIVVVDKRLSAINDEIELKSDKIEELNEREIKARKELGINTEKVAFFNANADNYKKSLDEYEEKKNHIENIRNLLKVNAETNYESLKNYIDDLCNNEQRCIYDNHAELDKLSKRQKSLQDGKVVKENEDILHICSVMNKNKYKAVSGLDYLSGIDNIIERTMLIEKYKYLPNAIVCEDSCYDKIEKLIKKEHIGVDNIIVIIKESALKSDISADLKVSNEAGKECIKLLCGDSELDKDESSISVELSNMELLILKKNTELKNHMDNLSMYKKYYYEVCSFADSYMNSYESNKKEYESNTKAVSKLEDINNNLRKELSDIDTEIESYYSALEKLKEDREIVLKLKESIGYRIDLDSHVEVGVNDLKSYNDELVSLEKTKTNIKTKMQNLHVEVDNKESYNVSLKQRKESLENDWNNKYMGYYDADFVIEDFNKFSNEDIYAKADAAIAAYETENVDVTNLIELCKNYSDSIAECEKKLEKAGFSVDFYKEYEANNDIIFTELELDNAEQNLKTFEHKKSVSIENIYEKKGMISELTGRLNNCIENYNNNYGKDRPYDMNEVFGGMVSLVDDENDIANPELGMRNHKNMKNMLGSELKKLTDNESKLRDDYDKINLLREKLKEYALSLGVSYVQGDIILKDIEDYEIVSKNVNSLKDKIKQNKDKSFNILRKVKDSKERCVKEISELNEEYANRIEKMDISNDSAELSKQINDLTVSRSYLLSEIDNITESLAEILEIKNRFNKKCIQKSLAIKADIEKFGKYSTMFIDGEEIQAVKLKIHYYPEEIQAAKMEKYIDRIVNDTASFDNDEDKKRILRDKLSGRSLFNVIVDDSKGYELSLYKRERIKENSRHLRYEEAVGSTGQSQGIYILLIIAIVNYISRMYSDEIDDSSITKTIFIDNPFGAAKDVYIWEPILSMLKDNNVQIIIPTRGVAPAMTSKFEVYYTLGQKMAGNKMQTVVVNYESNIDNESVEFFKTNEEQLDIFSMLGDINNK
ncbi:MAG: hypothetical protein K6G26_13845 [Lachnospiraceae bacterium]|nr:hypothetical protein [Lachnospiraceae bacterium]